MVPTKEGLRREVLKKRRSLSEEERSSRDIRIRERLRNLPEFRTAKKILMFYPAKGEPDITPLLEEVLREGRSLFLPKVEGERIKAVRVRKLSELSEGSFGIPEPAGGEEIDPSSLEAVVVPGVVFDRSCYRIGFGRGYYDRFLPLVKAPKIGVAYSFQVFGEVPRDPWDVPLDLIVTDTEVIRRS